MGPLEAIAWISLGLSIACAAAIAAHVARHRLSMPVMNAVWPITALYAGPVALAAYFADRRRDRRKRSPWRDSAVAATHCGAGCCLGDVAAEGIVKVKPLALFGSQIAATWTLDFALAFACGIAFQYASIKPMRQLSPGRGLVAALKADTLSLTAWQVGMYGAMAIAIFGLAGGSLDSANPVFWLAMQGAMVAGFLVAWPVNAALLAAGIKERM